MGRYKKVDTINLQNFENALDISLKQKNIASKKSRKRLITLHLKGSYRLKVIVPRESKVKIDKPSFNDFGR